MKRKIDSNILTFESLYRQHTLILIFEEKLSLMKPVISERYNYTRQCLEHKKYHPGVFQMPPECTETLAISVLTLGAKEMPENWCLNRKNVILVVDVSASMLHTMNSLKASILTFRDLISGRKNSKQPVVSDEQFKEILPNFHLITFSDEAVLKWSNNVGGRGLSSGLSFDDFVGSLEVEGSTNMGAALELAYSLCPNGGSATMQGSDALASWIVVLTDGASNRGKHQTAEAFAELETEKPPNTKIISLGYGTDFEVATLDVIGDFTHLPDSESIPGFMGALSHEISTCGLIDVRIGLNDLTGPRDILFGSQKVGWFANERKYYFGFVPVWELPLTGENVSISYKEIREDGIWGYQTAERISNELPLQTLTPEIRGKIASFHASKLIKELYGYNRRKIGEKVKQILSIVEQWTEPGMEEARETVKRVCRDALKSYRTESASFQTANSLQNQSAYVGPLFQTPTSMASIQKAVDLAKTYL